MLSNSLQLRLRPDVETFSVSDGIHATTGTYGSVLLLVLATTPARELQERALDKLCRSRTCFSP